MAVLRGSRYDYRFKIVCRDEETFTIVVEILPRLNKHHIGIVTDDVYELAYEA